MTTSERGDLEALRQRVVLLTEENIRLREAVAARDAFLAVAGHELRNPMTPVLGRLEMLNRAVCRPDFQREQVKDSLEQIEWLIGQYMKRTRTMIDVSRLTSGRLALGRAPVEVGGLLRRVAENFRPIAEHAGCALTTNLPDVELTVVGDWFAIEDIVDNLVSNAVKYGRGKPIAIDAGLGAEAGHVSVHVRDQGPGISEANQRRIFECFERAAPVEERRSGFGVGLWIVGQLTEAMGGKIEVVSRAGAGSTFCVSLPVG